ncbi:hypothetical protein [Janthinobacterium sp.]|uniref:hypothetical protein n=1 Tax=Janthinobacterium sp. TaxID=1871054 RepID=UPI00293D603A|nr:hypothetical protein [Janthinobacterium sp.]
MRKLPKELVRLRLDSADVREPRVAFADVDHPKIAGPVVEILKQMEVNRPQGRQGNVVEVRFVLVNTGLGQLDFCRVQGVRITNAKLVDQYVRVRIAVLSVLACSILIGHAWV